MPSTTERSDGDPLNSVVLLRSRAADAIAVMQGIAADDELAAAVSEAVDAIVGAIAGGGKVLLCGNGGSSADSQHLASEMVGRFTKDREPWPAICLSDNVAAMTAIANDYSYAEVYDRIVRAFARRGDVLLGISTSGHSPNVVSAIEAANALGVRTVALAGPGDSPMSSVASIVLRVNGPNTARIQEGQKFIGHALFENVELRLTEG